MDGLGAVETIEAGGGENQGVAIALIEFAETGVDVAADFDEGDVGTKREDLSAAAGAGGADASSGGEGVKCPVGLADPDVAGVGAFGDGSEGELGGEFGGKVFKGVNGEVDSTFFEGFLDLLNEDAFAVEVWRRNEAWLLHPVAGGADDLDLGGVAGFAQGIEDVIRLPEGELGTPAAYADGAVWMEKL